MQDALLTTLENSRTYTLAVAEAMPENLYDSKPFGAGWNFRELLDHMAYGITWWENNFVKSNKIDWNPPAAKKNKQEVITYLNQSYDSLQNTIQKEKLTDRVMTGFFATLDHITHHRGQAVLFLKAQQITPPEYMY